MEGYVVSVNDNVLSVSLLGSNEVFERELPRKAASESSILDVEIFSENLGEMLLESFGGDHRKLPLHFLIPSNEVVLNFLTESKKSKEGPEEHLSKDISKRLASVALTPEDVYFSSQKIAPFVHQLVATKKDVLEKYLSIGEMLGLEVRSVVPWVLLLPKFLPKPVEPKIFILKSADEETLVLSELGGVYHVGRFNEKKASDLKKLIKELSVYERNQPISDIYLFGINSFDLGDDYKVSKLTIESIHDLYQPGVASDVLNTQINLLSLLPVTEVKERNLIPVYIGITIAAFIAVLGFAYAKGYFGRGQEEVGVPTEVQETTTTDAIETSPSAQPSGDEEIGEEVELNKAYLRIRVENGTNIGGLAGRTRDHLSQFGYEIVAVGDADESDRAVTLVRFSPENSIYEEVLVADLLEMYADVEVQTDLSSELEYDVLIIAGTNEK